MNTYTNHLMTAGAQAYAAKLQENLAAAIATGNKAAEASLLEQINQFFATSTEGQAGIPVAVMA